jgi:spermidine synthase
MKENILKNKTYLYLTEFFSGMSVMAVELAASRLMAPYFSSSQIVYTIIIGTVMIAMALGNVYGGRSADKNPDPAVLYRRILIAAAWIAAIPFAGRFLILAISAALVLTVNTNFLIIAAFASCMIIFVFPLFLLGTVTPSLVRYIIENTEESGEIVGKLGAFNTVGSIIGTFLPTFVTIPTVGTAATYIIFSGVLLILALLYFFSIKKITKLCIITIIIFVICAVIGSSVSFAFWDPELAYEGESVYNYLQVKESDDRVVLSTNVLFGVQSVKMKTDELTGMYYDYALAAPAMAMEGRDDKLDILVLGNGTGTFAAACQKYYPGCTVTGVEIDGKISDLAYEYFDMSDDVEIYEYDGRAFLQAVKDKYDVIMVDAYQDITIPFQMSSLEFFSMVYDHLKENGSVVVNMNMHSDGEGAINEYLTDTILECFDTAYSVDVPYNSNREVFMVKEGDPKDRLANGMALISHGVLSDTQRRLVRQLGTVYSNMEECSASGLSHVLTDDKAPVEILGMSMIDSLITEEISYYRGIYDEGGIDALMNALL